MRSLAPRELEVLYWASQGKTGAEIATILGVKYSTTRLCVNRLLMKLDATNLVHAVAKGYEMRLLGKKDA